MVCFNCNKISHYHDFRLCNCNISVKGCGFLASALRFNPSHLRELYLNWNHPIDPGTNPLTELLKTLPPNLKLEKLEYVSLHLHLSLIVVMIINHEQL